MGFNIEELGRLLGMPPILLGHSSAGQTMWGTGVESIIQAWYTLGLRALLTRIEKCVQFRVIKRADQGKYYFKFNVGGLLRGDSQTQALIASTLAQNGLRSRDELRALDDFGKIPGGGGEHFTAQTNLATLDRIANPPEVQPGAFGDPAQEAAVENMIRRAIERDRAANQALDALRQDRERFRPAA
jgi:hypothetical protein